MSAQLSIIVAIDAQGGIGVRNTLPWHLPEDLAFFKRTTSGHPIIMGRKTFDSIGRPLPKRRNIVVTRNTYWRHDGVEAASSLTQAIGLVEAGDAFIIGGAQIFHDALPLVERMIVTRIDKNFECDTFFPAVEWSDWQEVSREPQRCETDGFDFAFVTYERKHG